MYIIITFRALNGMAPASISDFTYVRKHPRYSLRSNSGTILLHPAGKMKKSFGDRSFSVAAPILWNALPASLRNIDSICIGDHTVSSSIWN